MRTYQDELSHSRARHCACMTMCQHSRDSLFRGRASWRPCPPAPPRCLPSSCLRRASVASGGVAAFGCLRPHVRPAARFVCPEIVGAASVENAPTPPRGRAGWKRVGWDRGGSPRDPGFRFIFEINTRCRTGRNTHGAHRRGPLAFALFQERRRGGRQPRCARSRQLSPRYHTGARMSPTSESSHIVADRTGPSPVGHALPVAASFAVPTPAEGGRARLFRNGRAQPLGREWRTI